MDRPLQVRHVLLSYNNQELCSSTVFSSYFVTCCSVLMFADLIDVAEPLDIALM